MRLELGDLYLTPGGTIFEVHKVRILDTGDELTFNIVSSPVPNYTGLVMYHGNDEIATIMRCLRYMGHKNQHLGRLLYG